MDVNIKQTEKLVFITDTTKLPSTEAANNVEDCLFFSVLANTVLLNVLILAT